MGGKLTLTASAGAWVPGNPNPLTAVKFYAEEGKLGPRGNTSQKS